MSERPKGGVSSLGEEMSRTHRIAKLVQATEPTDPQLPNKGKGQQTQETGLEPELPRRKLQELLSDVEEAGNKGSKKGISRDIHHVVPQKDGLEIGDREIPHHAFWFNGRVRPEKIQKLWDKVIEKHPEAWYEKDHYSPVLRVPADLYTPQEA